MSLWKSGHVTDKQGPDWFAGTIKNYLYDVRDVPAERLYKGGSHKQCLPVRGLCDTRVAHTSRLFAMYAICGRTEIGLTDPAWAAGLRLAPVQDSRFS